ncbi:protein phosphatase 1 regulatory subunit 35 [Rhinolophus ferrumequinum]|uniref:Protein phosphatase 1 regulatory subunit 35 n=1 Tax=Rhinolophus ferrumequinum TaxID=59479 RepID=A0A671DVR7_RHIFE|nr:protein phosphatase 1 regulatory subunit 35 isoform X1 [Rhinolophus ferrumequinum]KAF6357428.1 protein phosphatase 1 regulatory subunit 35 [Rhinolophus ferrumequinum]
MMGCEESELELVEGEEAMAVPGSPPEPRVPEPGAPVPEPGLDLSLSPSPRSESPKRLNCSPGRRKGRAERRGGARKGRQVRFRLAPPSPVRYELLPAVAAPIEKPAAVQDLGAPAPQSSLALSLELQAARAAAAGQFDATKAVEEQLRKSFQTRCGLEESVAEGLNVPRSRLLFRDLVSLQVPEEQVLNAALKEKLALLPPQVRAPPPKEPPGPGPDMTILCDPETLFYESPYLTLDGLPPLRLQLRSRPSEDTFLMHRILKRWEA